MDANLTIRPRALRDPNVMGAVAVKVQPLLGDKRHCFSIQYLHPLNLKREANLFALLRSILKIFT